MHINEIGIKGDTPTVPKWGIVLEYRTHPGVPGHEFPDDLYVTLTGRVAQRCHAVISREVNLKVKDI